MKIYPNPTISNCVVEAYNGLLSTYWLLNHSDASLMLDNKVIYGLCQNNLNTKRPSYDNLNTLIANVISSMTAKFKS